LNEINLFMLLYKDMNIEHKNDTYNNNNNNNNHLTASFPGQPG